jgi:hypothetical protein
MKVAKAWRFDMPDVSGIDGEDALSNCRCSSGGNRYRARRAAAAPAFRKALGGRQVTFAFAVD